MQHIEIPDPPIKPEIDWIATTDEQYTVDVWMGREVVMTVAYPRRYSGDGSQWAGDAEDACRMALTEFGQRLKKLIGG